MWWALGAPARPDVATGLVKVNLSRSVNFSLLFIQEDCGELPSVDAAIKAIGEPRRREILRLVWDAERSSGEIASHFAITGPAVSQHLKVLREAGLVNERRAGTRHLFSANRQALRDLRDQLAWMWDDGLADLKQAAEHEARKTRGNPKTPTTPKTRRTRSRGR